MKCDEVRELFSDFFDGGAQEISAHLSDCPACASEYENFCELMREIRDLPEPQLPSGFSDALVRGVHAEKRKRRRVVYQQFALLAAASVLLAVIWFTGVAENFAPRDDVALYTDIAPARLLTGDMADIAPAAGAPMEAADFFYEEADVVDEEEILWAAEIEADENEWFFGEPVVDTVEEETEFEGGLMPQTRAFSSEDGGAWDFGDDALFAMPAPADLPANVSEHDVRRRDAYFGERQHDAYFGERQREIEESETLAGGILAVQADEPAVLGEWRVLSDDEVLFYSVAVSESETVIVIPIIAGILLAGVIVAFIFTLKRE